LSTGEVYRKDCLVCTVSNNDKISGTIKFRLTGTTPSMIRRYWSRDVRPLQEGQIGFKPNNRAKNWVLDAILAKILRDAGQSYKKISEVSGFERYTYMDIITLVRDYKKLIRPISSSK
jgi:hypothetical protein